MHYNEISAWTAAVAGWCAEYYQGLRDRPVRSQVQAGEIASQIASQPPEHGEPMEKIFDDFQRIIPSGMTHWQHPRFLAYFPSNAAPASIIAEQLVSAMAAQCMLWQTSPAATELEAAMVGWFRQAVGLPDFFAGVIQDTATTTTLSAVLTMREKALQWQGLQSGLSGMPALRIYASDQNHSSIDKAVRLAGIGQNNLVKIPTDSTWSMQPELLKRAISQDRQNGFLPAGVIGCVGGTSIGACDRLSDVLRIAQDERLYSHVDAAWAGSAMICPELRSIWAGIELADSIVINPHKWLGANFDCSIQFLKEPELQIRTLAVRPRYLETLESPQSTNFSDWTIPLGRRFRALKLWFLFRAYGLEGLRDRIRNHIRWAHQAAHQLASCPNFQITTWPVFSLFTFRWTPPGNDADQATQRLLERINADGQVYLTQTTHEGQFVIRFSVGQFDAKASDIEMAVAVIRETAAKLQRELTATLGLSENR